MKEQALEYLQQDKLLHISMTEPIKRGMAEILYADKEGVLTRLKDQDMYMLSVSNVKKGLELLNTINNPQLLVVHQEYLAEPAQEIFGWKDSMVCYQAAYTREEPIQIEADVDIRCLGESYGEIMAQYYHSGADAEYMKELARRGVMHGIFVENQLAGFAGMHSEGSIGLLEIFPEHQRKGLAQVLEGFMINWNLQKGWVPFGQIVEGNEASMGLQRKLGMEFAKEKIVWLY